MKRNTAYFIIIVSSLLLFSCSNEEEIYPSVKESITIEMPVSIEITSGKASQAKTRAADDTGSTMVPGTCDVNEVLLLVFSGESSITDRTKLTYDSQKILTCKQEGGKWVARGSITGVTNKKYSVFALAYNKEKEGDNFFISPSPLVNTTTYGETKVALSATTILGTLNKYQTPEFFAGNVMPQGVSSEIFPVTENGEIALTGTLYRAVGKCTFTLTGIPANIKKITWLTEKIADSNLIYRSNEILGNEYPMGIPSVEEQRKYISQVAEAEHTTNETWDTTLETFLIPLRSSLFYIEATDETGASTRYLVRCPDQWKRTIWIAFLSYGVQDYRFTIAPNYLISVSGSYEQLQTAGSIRIDLSPMEEYDGGLLPLQ